MGQRFKLGLSLPRCSNWTPVNELDKVEWLGANLYLFFHSQSLSRYVLFVASTFIAVDRAKFETLCRWPHTFSIRSFETYRCRWDWLHATHQHWKDWPRQWVVLIGKCRQPIMVFSRCHKISWLEMSEWNGFTEVSLACTVSRKEGRSFVAVVS